MWGAAQQVSGPSPCSLGLEDVETKVSPKPQGSEAEAPLKVIGPSPCQSIKGGDKGQVAQKLARKREVILCGQAQCPLRITLSQHLPAFPCPPRRLGGL